jgi:hypothetical protein
METTGSVAELAVFPGEDENGIFSCVNSSMVRYVGPGPLSLASGVEGVEPMNDNCLFTGVLFKSISHQCVVQKHVYCCLKILQSHPTSVSYNHCQKHVLQSHRCHQSVAE